MNDWRLLRQYVEDGSQTAFAKLIERHYKLVYSTCLREVRDRQLAEDVTQAVFLVLSKKAPAMRSEIPLSGWLFNTSRFASMTAIKRESRRRVREQGATEDMLAAQSEQGSAWREIDPILNDAISSLRPPDREALLLRFYHDLSLAETGKSLGISEDAARMRVARAVERIRLYLAKSGVAVSWTTLTVLLGLYAVAGVAEAGALLLIEALPEIAGGAAGTGLLSAGVYKYAESILQAIASVKKRVIAAGAAACLLVAITVSLVAYSHGIRRPMARTVRPVTSGISAGYRSVELWRSNKGDPAAAKLLDDMVAAYQGLTSYSATVEASGGLGPRPNGTVIFIEDIALVRPNKIAIQQGALSGIARGKIRHIVPQSVSDGIHLRTVAQKSKTVAVSSENASALLHRAFAMSGVDRSMLPILLTVPTPLADMFGGDGVNKDNLKSFSVAAPGTQDGVATDHVIVVTNPNFMGRKIEMTYDFVIGHADHLLRQVTTVRKTPDGLNRITYNENHIHVTANPHLSDSLFAIK